MNHVNVQAKVDTLEVWEIENTTHLIHPFHLHTHLFQILARHSAQSNIWQPEPFRAWRDTVNLPGKESLSIGCLSISAAGDWECWAA